MKKKVKSLIIAASVAAVAGIGAVSFAAWNVNVDSAVDATGGALGNVAATVGFVVVSNGAQTPDLTIADKLMPYDQAEADLETGEIQMWTVALANINVTEKAWTAKLELKSDSETLETGSKFYYTVATTAPNHAEAADLANWKELNGTNLVEIANSEAQTLTGYNLYIILDSTNLKDMDKSGFKFTLTLAEKAGA